MHPVFETSSYSLGNNIPWEITEHMYVISCDYQLSDCYDFLNGPDLLIQTQLLAGAKAHDPKNASRNTQQLISGSWQLSFNPDIFEPLKSVFCGLITDFLMLLFFCFLNIFFLKHSDMYINGDAHKIK